MIIRDGRLDVKDMKRREIYRKERQEQRARERQEIINAEQRRRNIVFNQYEFIRNFEELRFRGLVVRRLIELIERGYGNELTDDELIQLEENIIRVENDELRRIIINQLTNVPENELENLVQYVLTGRRTHCLIL